MTQMGTRSVSSPRAARKIRSFFSSGKPFRILESAIFVAKNLNTGTLHTRTILAPAISGKMSSLLNGGVLGTEFSREDLWVLLDRRHLAGY